MSEMKPLIRIDRTAIHYHGFSSTGTIAAFTSLANSGLSRVVPDAGPETPGASFLSEPENYHWLHKVGMPPSVLAFAKQVHGNNIVYVDKPGVYGEADGLYTDQPNVGLTIRTADCAAVMVAVPEMPLVGIAHAGWRGTKSQIVKKLIELMQCHSDEPVRKALVVLSPHIKVCCYEVGREFERYFPPQFLLHREGRLFFDMEKALVHQITEMGVPRGNLLISPYCTACSNLPLYSYRKQKTTKRLFNIITIKGGDS